MTWHHDRHIYHSGGVRAPRPRRSADTLGLTYSNHLSYVSNATSPASWPNAEDAKFGYPGVAGSSWAEPRCGVSAVMARRRDDDDAAAAAAANITNNNGSGGGQTEILMKQPCIWNLAHRPWQPVGGAPPVWVENVRAHLARPGEAYVECERGELLFYPPPGDEARALGGDNSLCCKK